MARVTVEDCVLKVPNRFELVLLAAQRGRDISAGSPLTVDRDNDKNPVVSLREIAEGTVQTTDLSSAVVQALQKHVEIDEPEDDGFDTMAGEIAADIGEVIASDEIIEDVLTIEEGPSALDDDADMEISAAAEDDDL